MDLLHYGREGWRNVRDRCQGEMTYSVDYNERLYMLGLVMFMELSYRTIRRCLNLCLAGNMPDYDITKTILAM